MNMRYLMISVIAILLAACGTPKNDGTIVIKGKVQFPDNQFKMMIYRSEGFDKIIVDSFEVKPDNTYEYTMKVDEPGEYSLDCQKWQRVQFWAEDENLEINFRGQDTAKIKIKNPPFVYINGGPSNEVMNMINFNSYRGYQMMIAISQASYKALKDDMTKYGEVSGEMYGALGDESFARTKYIVEHYADRNSVLAAVKRMNAEKNAELIEKTLAVLESKNPNYAPLVKYKKEVTEMLEQKRRVAIGSVAPHFECATQDGKMVSPEDFKGKLLVIDFWASWCGPCRQEIPHVKEVFEKYKDKGVAVLSVSIDKKEKDWLKALSEENMGWQQIRATDSGKQLMKDYQFSGIPFIILLDKEGKIVAKNLRGEKLDEAIDGCL
ncbi:DUF4369 domain-containing protein [Marinilabiliaceae bacterium JC017]|nr:DUF4369 domain-containing protein [Marinilabiliaceae bacterium JC017]